MVDVFTRAKRSQVMACIRSRGNTDTELALARLLRAAGITGWRRQLEVRIAERGAHGVVRPTFCVKPDFVSPKLKVAVFVDGCFWHGCPKHATWPANRAAWWRRKLKGNRARDRIVNRVLRRAGWRVVRIWEHEVQQAIRSRSKSRKLSTPLPLPGRGGEGGLRLVARLRRLRRKCTVGA